MQRWQVSMLRRFLRILLTCTASIYGFWTATSLLWTLLHWSFAAVGTVALALGLHENMVAMRLYFRSPAFRPVPADGNADRVLHSGIKRLCNLQFSPGILTDVLGYLPRSHADACLLVCRDFCQAIDERAKYLALYRMTVALEANPPLFIYSAEVAGRGSVQGSFFYGLRIQDRQYFRNAALIIGIGSNLVSKEVLGSFLQGLPLDERNLRIRMLACPAYANEASDIFEIARACDIPTLKISYAYRRKHTATDFIAAVFKEARSARLSQLNVSIEDIEALSCATADAVGRKLISEILAHSQTPAAKIIVLTLPQLGTYPLIGRLIEALVRESARRPCSIVKLEFPPDVSLAELWPNHSDYFNETKELWTVPHRHGLIIMRPTSISDTNAYVLVTLFQ